MRGLGGDWLPDGLILPVGFALLVAICSFTTYIGWLVAAAGWIALAAALAGFALAARAGTLRRPRLDGRLRLDGIPWGALAGLAAFAAIAAPTLLTGTPTWTGYTRIDRSRLSDGLLSLPRRSRTREDHVRLLLSRERGEARLDRLSRGRAGDARGDRQADPHRRGVVLPDVSRVRRGDGRAGDLLAAGARSRKRAPGRTAAGRPLRAIAAAVAIQPTVLYGYALEGGIKELTTASLLLTVVAVLAERLPGRGPRMSVLPAAVAIAASIAAFSFGVAPWLGVLLAAAFVLTLLSAHRLRTIADWALLTGLAIVIALPEIISALTQLGGIASNAIGGTIEPRSRQPVGTGAGMVCGRGVADGRLPFSARTTSTATHALDVFVIALAVLGTLVALVRRRWVLAFAGVAAPIALWYYVAHSTAWMRVQVVHDHRRVRAHARVRGRDGAEREQTGPPSAARLAGRGGDRRRGAVRERARVSRHDAGPRGALSRARRDRQALRRAGPDAVSVVRRVRRVLPARGAGTTDVQPAYDELGLLPAVSSRPGWSGSRSASTSFRCRTCRNSS